MKNLYNFIILFLVLHGAQAWFTWPLSDLGDVVEIIFYIIVCNGLFWSSRKRGINIRLNGPEFKIFIVYILLYFINWGGMTHLFTNILRGFVLYLVLLNHNNYRDTLDNVSKAISLILLPGLILFVALFFVDIQPFFGIIFRGTSIDELTADGYVFQNYGVLLYSYNDWSSTVRFQSIFLEPGFLGTMISFMLYARRFEYRKWDVIVMLISLLLTFSLAGYITTILGYIFYKFSEGKSTKGIVIILSVLLGFQFIALDYNEGDNYLNKLIVSRLERDSEKGIVGNNRGNDFLDSYYDRMLSDGSILFGIGNAEVERINGGETSAKVGINGAGYKLFLIKYGLIKAFAYLFLYILIICFCAPHQKMYRSGFLIIIFATFLQVAMPASWSWLLPLVLGLSNSENLTYASNEDIIR